MKKQPDKIGFSFLKVTTEQFAVLEDGFNEKGEIRLSTSLRFGTDETQKHIAVFALFVFESDQKPFIIVEAGCHFKIADAAWSDMYNIKANSLKVPKGFLSHLVVLTIGTSRGILHSKTEGTCFNKYVLPTINVTEIIKDDAIFALNKSEK